MIVEISNKIYRIRDEACQLIRSYLAGRQFVTLKSRLPHVALIIIYLYSRSRQKKPEPEASQGTKTDEEVTKRVSTLEINQGKITIGQGEYIVFHKLPTGERKMLSYEIFEKIYKVLLQYSPAVLLNGRFDKEIDTCPLPYLLPQPPDAVNSRFGEAIEECANRYELIKNKLKEIDSTLEAVFVPRTLYELIFIRKCIKEDLTHKEICPLLTPFFHQDLKKKESIQKERKCWHLCHFIGSGDYEHPGVKNVAYRLNKVIAKAFNPSNEGFTLQEFSALAEKEIEFLKTFHKNVQEDEKMEFSRKSHGPTANFSSESTSKSIKPMGIRDETDAQIIRDAIALECSKIAQHSIFLYRGADFQEDSISCKGNESKPYNLSYGTGLFAGCLFDGGATAFHYMRNEKNAYAIPVSFDRLNDSPFFIPTTHTIAQLFGNGELFHARTRVWKDYNSPLSTHRKSSLNEGELTRQFQTYKNAAIQLKENV